ncbi:MAG: hypothetical protein FWF51_10700, partial [Chitinivibrionia bacterium]|nr:hypothetical protein [Chitinivibrionia bacterium]
PATQKPCQTAWEAEMSEQEIVFSPKIKKLLFFCSIFVITAAIAVNLLLYLPQSREIILELLETTLKKTVKDSGSWIVLLIDFVNSFIPLCLVFLFIISMKNKELNIKNLLKNRIFQISSVVFVLFPFVIGQRENPIIIFQTIFAAIILSSTFALFFVNLYAKTKQMYEAFVKTLLFYSMFIVFTTEILSFFKILKFGVILTVWLLFLCVQLYVYLSKNKRMEFGFPKTINFNFETRVLLLILAVTFFIAAIYPPNNWDSMTYHIPRIEHWIQNESVEHYETSNLRQTLSAPFAEFVIMHGRILSGGDSLMNLVQWFAFIFSLAIIYRILNMFGIDKRNSIYGILFFATTPMAILQASSTQTDLVEALFILILAERLLTWKKEYNVLTAFEFGIALGLAVLAKGTAYPIALIFVVVFALISLKHFKQRIIGAILAAFIAFSINFCHYSRNYIAYGEPLGKHGGTVSDFKLNSFLASFPAHIYINCGVPIPNNLFSNISNKYYEILGIDTSKVFHYGNPKSNGIKDFVKFHEDTAKNPVQMLIILILGIVLIANKKYKCYCFFSVIVVSAWFVFIYCIPWQPWITRLQLPLFALSAPMFGFWCSQTKEKRLANIILVIMVIISVLPLIRNQSRPVIKSLYSDRFKPIFNNKNEMFYKNFKNAVSEIDRLKIKNLGIIIGSDSWEYPLFAYNYKNPRPKITHILSYDLGKIDENIDVLFVLERYSPEIESIIGQKPQHNDRQPFVLKRDNEKWEIIYRP